MTNLLHPYPNGTPSDAELEALRDADHARDIAAWEARGKCLCGTALRIVGKCLCGAT